MTSGSPNSLIGAPNRYERSFTACVPVSLLVTAGLRRRYG